MCVAVRMDFVGEREMDCVTQSMFPIDVLGRPLLALSNIVPISINFLCYVRIDGSDSSVVLLSLPIQFCFNKQRDTFRGTHFVGVQSISQFFTNRILETNKCSVVKKSKRLIQ